MAYWTEFSADPTQNTKNPPLGAGENALPQGRISDTFRVVMAAVREVGDLAFATASALGTMAAQAASNVAISGGIIGGTTQFVGTVASGAIVVAETISQGTLALARLPTSLTGKLADGLTTVGKQAIYDLVYPVGRIMLWHTATPGTGLVWSGITATWVEVTAARDAVIVAAGTKTDERTVAGSALIGNAATTSADGAHSHGGATENTALSSTNLPAIAVTVAVSATEKVDGGADKDSNVTAAYSGSASHSHPISGVFDHTHTLTHATKRFGFVVLERTA